MRKSIFILSVLCSAVLFENCKKTEAEPEENELITTVKLNFKEGTNNLTFSWKDLDGDGGAAPVINEIVLAQNKTYSMDVEFLDESKSPAVNITNEILEEADEHLVVFGSNPTSLFTYSYTDQDSNKLPIGIKGQLKTNNAGVGKLRLQLRHQPPINMQRTKNGTASPGSDDINIEYAVNVK